MRRFAAAVPFLVMMSAADADVRQGARALLSGQESQAIELLLPDAQRGDAEAQYWLSEALRSRLNGRAGVIVAGDDTDPAQQEIHGWLEKAARQGHARAMTRYALDLDAGFGTPPDFRAALEWLQKSAGLPDSPARTHLAIWYGTGHIVVPDRAKADELNAQRTEARDNPALREFAAVLEHSQPPVDPAASARDLAEAQSGNSMAAMRLAKAALANGRSDCGTALRWYQRAGELGNPDAYDALGDIRYFGRCGKQDLGGAHANFTRAADLGSSFSWQRLAGMEMFGHGRKPNLASAYLDLLLAQGLARADSNHADAMLRFARARLSPAQRQAIEARASARLELLLALQARWREQKTTRREVASGHDPASPPAWSYSIMRVDDRGSCVADPADCERSLTGTEVRIKNKLATPLVCTLTAPTPRNWEPPPPDIVREFQVASNSELVSRIVEESYELKLMTEDASAARIDCVRVGMP